MRKKTCLFLFMGCNRSPISLMCLLKAAPKWTENKKEVGKEIKREFIQSILRTALCGGFQAEREKEAGCGELEADSRR